MSDRITAKFIGKHGSLGYEKNRVYTLKLVPSLRFPVVVRRVDGSGYCPYSSWEAFRRNWEIWDVKPTGWHLEESSVPALACYTTDCKSPFHVEDVEETDRQQRAETQPLTENQRGNGER